MESELLVVLGLIVFLIFSVAIQEHRKKKTPSKNESNRINDYVETKTREMPIVDF